MQDWAYCSVCRPTFRLSVSLIGRARDLALGIPLLLVWQWIEVRRLRPARRAEPGPRSGKPGH